MTIFGTPWVVLKTSFNEWTVEGHIHTVCSSWFSSSHIWENKEIARALDLHSVLMTAHTISF